MRTAQYSERILTNRGVKTADFSRQCDVQTGSKQQKLFILLFLPIRLRLRLISFESSVLVLLPPSRTEIQVLPRSRTIHTNTLLHTHFIHKVTRWIRCQKSHPRRQVKSLTPELIHSAALNKITLIIDCRELWRSELSTLQLIPLTVCIFRS